MKKIIKRSITFVIVLTLLVSDYAPMQVFAACAHNSYLDYYKTSDYTGNYNNAEHEVRHYYDRTCTDCGKTLDVVTSKVWVSHKLNNDECVCGYIAECSHNSYKDHYETSDYTGDYDKAEHEVRHYYNRTCKECKDVIDIVTEEVWVKHKFSGSSCECGYTKTCEHNNYTDTFTYSELTGKTDSDSHQLKHYYNRTCNSCGDFIKEVSSKEWIAHEFSGNECWCGYSKACEHSKYTDTFSTSVYTGEYNKSEHEVKHYYNRTCDTCGDFIKEVSQDVWVDHKFSGNKCECGYSKGCAHSKYTDTFNTSVYTGEYNKDEHEVKHYYNRICDTCGDFIKEVSQDVWVAHKFSRSSCECGYTKICEHKEYTDIFTYSELTGETDSTSHQLKHYYNRTCNTCGDFIKEVSSKEWIAHEFSENECWCGYSKVCEHSNYTDTFTYSELTGETDANTHQLKHYYNRTCNTCGVFIKEVSSKELVAHEFSGNDCWCGYSKACAHSKYTDTFTYSELTGETDSSSHQLKHYYNRTCNTCGDFIKEVSSKELVAHEFSGNDCWCGYSKECKHTNYTDSYTYSDLTWETNADTHKIMHYYNRYCDDCHKFLQKVSSDEWVAHEFSGNKCECGYSKSCAHSSYTDTYKSTAYTSKYSELEHYVIHHYDRTCDDCGNLIKELTQEEWAEHKFSGYSCSCGYSKVCKHKGNCTDSYAYSKYTGVYTETEHEVKHYYSVTCSTCGEFIGDVWELGYGTHKLSGNKCECGYTEKISNSEATGAYKETYNEVNEQFETPYAYVENVNVDRDGIMLIHTLGNESTTKLVIEVLGKNFYKTKTVDDCEDWFVVETPKTGEYNIVVTAYTKSGGKYVSENFEIYVEKYNWLQKTFLDISEDYQVRDEIYLGLFTAVAENTIIKPAVSIVNALDYVYNYPSTYQASLRAEARNEYVKRIEKSIEEGLPYGANYYYVGQAIGDVVNIGVDTVLIVNGIKSIVTGVKTLSGGVKIITAQVANATTGGYETVCIVVDSMAVQASAAQTLTGTMSFAIAVASGFPSDDWEDVDAVEEDADEATSSRKLQNNMEKAGRYKPSNYSTATHHIVAGGSHNEDAVASREILKKFGIGVNNEANGVYLPTQKGLVNSAYHPSLHTKDYHRKVHNLLRDASSREEVIEILHEVSEQLFKGSF